MARVAQRERRAGKSRLVEIGLDAERTEELLKIDVPDDPANSGDAIDRVAHDLAGFGGMRAVEPGIICLQARQQRRARIEGEGDARRSREKYVERYAPLRDFDRLDDAIAARRHPQVMRKQA